MSSETIPHQNPGGGREKSGAVRNVLEKYTETC